jgi:N4-gp56 family major capsid protein
MTLQYKAPPGTASSIGPQSVTHKSLKKAIVTARQQQFFTQLATVENMPKHFGKKMKVFEYIPLLDDRNVNDQGLDAAGATIANGNLYGSSKDIGVITSKLPLLTENGGRVNRVGFTRIEREGTIQKLGFFTEWTQESLDFDSDEELMSHLSTELLNGAVELSEAMLQTDLLLGAGVTVFAGAATTNATITGEGATPSVVDYEDLQRLSITLDNNRTPKHTKVITGSRLIDTRTVANGRIMYIGSELQPLVEGMKDQFNNPAFIPVHKYADAGNVVLGEIGTIGHWRLVVVPEMQHWAGVGATATGGNLGYRASGGKYSVYPMLAVGHDSFSTIGFQTDGKTVKFKITTRQPGEETADRNDPFGEKGFSSIKWYYGSIIKRPERIAVIKTVAPL